MVISETALELYNELEELKKILSKNKFNLIDLNLTNIVLSAKNFFSLTTLNEIFLEFLIKLSEAIYWKSCLLLNIQNKDQEERIENLKEFKFEEDLIKGGLKYYKALSLERVLYEKIFLPCIPNILEKFNERDFQKEGQKNLISKAIISILDREEIKEEILENLTSLSIEFYLETSKEYLQRRISFTFKEMIEEKLGKMKKDNLLEVIYYFLSFLFLCFEDLCYMVQNNENEDIIIFSKMHL
ncbi:MAG: hypothetical protein MW689_001282 [Thermodesulfobacteria bacterium]|nr:hypothetical protein [Thermodesulfobacteriota bacterium]MCU4137711.1 hypothetical protein [Thermodesulfobacteriota bacterium]